jgi:F-type H+-transporting ATPase subunit b
MDIIESLLSIGSIAESEIASPASKGFGFNSNILEANVINIIILASGVVYLGRNFLTSALDLRQQKVREAIQEAEERLHQASLRLSEAEKQMVQSKTVIEQIKKEAEVTARKVKESILAQGKLDIERLTNSGKSNIEKAETQIKKQIQRHVTNLAIRKVTSQLREVMTLSLQSKFIDSNISQLGGTI